MNVRESQEHLSQLFFQLGFALNVTFFITKHVISKMQNIIKWLTL